MPKSNAKKVEVSVSEELNNKDRLVYYSDKEIEKLFSELSVSEIDKILEKLEDGMVDYE